MTNHWLNTHHPSLQKKPKVPSAAFRKKMDAQVSHRIEQDQKEREMKKSSWLSVWIKKVRGVGIWVALCAFTLFLWSQFISSPWSSSSITDWEQVAVVAPVEESSRKQFKSSISAQLEQKKIAAANTPALLAYTKNAWGVSKFKRKIGVKKRG